jgi:predicted O-linked N-acetylglucosamine transferase (SPINDLY family)
MNNTKKTVTNGPVEVARGYFLKSLEKFEHGQYNEAENLLYRALELIPNQLSTLTNLCLVLMKQEKFLDASNLCRHAIKLHPEDETLFLIQGQLFEHGNNLTEALASYNKSLSINPDFSEARDCQENILLKKRNSDSFLYKGTMEAKSGNFEMALTFIKKAIEQDSTNPVAHNNYGNILYETQDLVGSLERYDLAIKFNPSYSEAYYNKGNALDALGRANEAIDSYMTALALNNHYAKAYFNLANILQRKNELKKALENYNKALEINPDLEYCLGALLHTKMLMCDWSNFYSNKDTIITQLKEGRKVATSFVLLSLLDSGSLQKKAAEIYMSDLHPERRELEGAVQEGSIDKIRIGYYSADFREHAVSYLMAELFETHDKDKFDIYGFYYGPLEKSSLQERIATSFKNFINVQNLSDLEIAKLSRDNKIDIAIDLTGMTRSGREGIFAYRVAPLQLSYIGYLGTMGANYYDYIVADMSIIPEANKKFYSEKIIYLPVYQVNDNQRKISNKPVTKRSLGLPDSGFIFCCLNSSYKITPMIFDSWVRILNSVAGSVLLLTSSNQWVEKNLKNEAIQRGLDPSRLIFCNFVSQDEYLVRYKCVDLFLDTFPYNAGTTASDAIRNGVPVLTLAGETFASRIASSLLVAMQVDELITHSYREYENLAIELSTSPTKLNAVKNKLLFNRQSSSLFNTKKFATSLEKAFTLILERYKKNLCTDHIRIS